MIILEKDRTIAKASIRGADFFVARIFLVLLLVIHVKISVLRNAVEAFRLDPMIVSFSCFISPNILRKLLSLILDSVC